jgi:hypothetical protein
MNKVIRWRGAYWGLAVTCASLFAVSPEAALALFRGDFTRSLWWGGLVAAFMAVSVLLEGLAIGRNTPHRGKVDEKIVRGVVGAVCGIQGCPEVERPSESTRSAAKALFFKKIDGPSRQVAFHYWGWYFSGHLGLWQVATAIAIALPLVGTFGTTYSALRWAALALLFAGLGISWKIRETWARKTLAHAQSQLIQIRDDLGNRLPGGTCARARCPAT